MKPMPNLECIFCCKTFHPGSFLYLQCFIRANNDCGGSIG